VTQPLEGALVLVVVGTVAAPAPGSRPRGDDVTAEKPNQSLQDVLDSVPNLVDHLYSNRKGSVLKDAVLRQPTEFVAPEFTTWRDEQRAWREGIAFCDQSFHMTTTYLLLPVALSAHGLAAFRADGTAWLVSTAGRVSVSGEFGDGFLGAGVVDELLVVGGGGDDGGGGRVVEGAG
jgi:hypothetical protein